MLTIQELSEIREQAVKQQQSFVLDGTAASVKQTTQLKQELEEAFIVMTRINGDMWKIVKGVPDKKEAQQAKKSIWVKSGKMKDKAILPISALKKNKWKMHGIVQWNGKGLYRTERKTFRWK